MVQRSLLASPCWLLPASRLGTDAGICTHCRAWTDEQHTQTRLADRAIAGSRHVVLMCLTIQPSTKASWYKSALPCTQMGGAGQDSLLQTRQLLRPEPRLRALIPGTLAHPKPYADGWSRSGLTAANAAATASGAQAASRDTRNLGPPCMALLSSSAPAEGCCTRCQGMLLEDSHQVMVRKAGRPAGMPACTGVCWPAGSGDQTANEPGPAAAARL